MALLLALIVGAMLMVLDLDGGFCYTGQMSIRSNALTSVDQLDTELEVERKDFRGVRKSPLNSSEIREVLEAHNTRRQWEEAADMEVMNWSPILASMADDWAKQCLWKHGQPKRDPGTVPYSWVGQNLYAKTGTSSISLTSAINSWYMEKSFYDYDTQRCQTGKVCGHYTQVVWSNSRDVGCAYARCRTLPSVFRTSAVYLVCNYGPGGNMVGTKPYQMGIPCTKCQTGSMWCNKGLCDGNCAEAGPNCACSPRCLNGGTVNRDACSCSCRSGWHGTDCSIVCRDTDSKCNPPRGVAGWPISWCNHKEFGGMVQEKCPAMCKICERA